MENDFFKRLKKVNYRMSPCCGNCASYHQTTEIDYWDSDFDDDPPENPDSVVSRMCYDEDVCEIDDKADESEEFFSPNPSCVCDKWRLKYSKFLFIDIDDVMTSESSGAISKNAMDSLIEIINAIPDITIVPMNIYNNGNVGGLDFRIEHIRKYLDANCNKCGFWTFLHTEIYTNSGIIGTIDSTKMLDFLNRIGNYDDYVSVMVLSGKELHGWLVEHQSNIRLHNDWANLSHDSVERVVNTLSDIGNVAEARSLCKQEIAQKESQEEKEKKTSAEAST